MNRVVSRLLGVVVILGGGAAAGHFGGQYYARGQIETAIGQLDRAGVAISYSSVAIDGLVLPQRGVVSDIDVYIPAIGWRFTLPEAASPLALDALDEFAFALPDEVAIDVTDNTGEPTGERLIVSGADMQAVLTATEENIYDFALTAQSAELVREGGGANERIVLTELLAETRIEVDRAAESISGEMTFDLAGFQVFTPGPQGAGAPSAEFYDVEGTASLDPRRFGFDVSVESGSAAPELLTGAPDGEATLERFTAQLEVAGRETLDLTALLALESFSEFPEAAFGVGSAAVLDGGRMDYDVGVGLVRFAAPGLGQRSPEFPIERIEISEFGYELDMGPEILGLKVAAEGVRGEGSEMSDIFFSYEDAELVIAANAGSNGFDYPALFAVEPADPSAPLAELVRQLREGGEGLVSFSTGPTEFRDRNSFFFGGAAPGSMVLGGPGAIADAPLGSDGAASTQIDRWGEPDPNTPRLVGGSSGSGAFALRMNGERVSLEYEVAESTLQLEGPVPGEIAAEYLSIMAEAPLAGSDALQTAPFRMALAGLTLDPAIWAIVDPAGAIDAESKTLEVTFNFDIDFDVPVGLLDNPEAYLGAIFAPRAIRFDPIAIEVAGMTASLRGESNLPNFAALGSSPNEPAGAFEIRVAGWRPVFDVLLQSPLFREDDAAVDLLTLEGVLIEYGADGEAPGETVFDIEFAGDAVIVNGATLDTPPVPAPPVIEQEPVEEATPTPNAEQ